MNQAESRQLFHKKNIISKEIIIPKNIESNPSSPSSRLSKEIDYSLNNSFFDPSQSSPPNDFLIKLEKRLQNYQSLGINEIKFVSA